MPLSNWDVTFFTGTATSNAGFLFMQVTPITVLTETSPGNGQGSVYQFLMTYNVTDVTAPDGTGAIIGEIAGLSGIAQTNGTVQFTKSMRSGTGADLGSSSVLITTNGPSVSSTTIFAPQTSISVQDSVNISSGTTSGAFASLFSFRNEVLLLSPEPVTYLLVSGALSLLGLVRLRVWRG